jgi:hypothetical protein
LAKKRSYLNPDRIRAGKRERRARWEEERRRRSSQAGILKNYGSKSASKLSRSSGAGQDRQIDIPKVFSFLDDPKMAIATLDEIREIANSRSTRNIHISHADCEKLDLAALLAADLILLRANHNRSKPNHIRLSGTFSKVSDEVNIMIKASGTPHHLKLAEARLKPEIAALVHRAELQRGNSKRIERSPNRNAACQNLTDYFDKCLGSLGYTLIKEGKNHLGKLLTEVIENAEAHGGGQWFTIGHWQRNQRSGTDTRSGDCHIAIINYGTTIYESLKSIDVSPELQEKLRALSAAHQGRNLFGERWDQEVLWTLYALQERVSRYVGLPGSAPDRGVGTIEIIEFFRKLGNGRMCIVSGKAYILFDDKYGLGEIQKDGETLKIIAFNEDNDLEEAPDSNYVFRLPSHFPGTIVSIDLTLDEAYLGALLKK